MQPTVNTAQDPAGRGLALLNTVFEALEHAIMAVLTVLIAVIAILSTWHLILLVLALLLEGRLDPADHEVLQSIFGTIFTVLIALEFKRSLLTVSSERSSVVRVRSVVLIAMLATVRKFIVMDIGIVQAGEALVIVAAMLALGVVYWLVRNHDLRFGRGLPSQPVPAQPGPGPGPTGVGPLLS